jgi:hypothetical protein
MKRRYSEFNHNFTRLVSHVASNAHDPAPEYTGQNSDSIVASRREEANPVLTLLKERSPARCASHFRSFALNRSRNAERSGSLAARIPTTIAVPLRLSVAQLSPSHAALRSEAFAKALSDREITDGVLQGWCYAVSGAGHSLICESMVILGASLDYKPAS